MDIVERIRKEIGLQHFMPPEMCGLGVDDMEEAASEIEQLRGSNNELLDALKELLRSLVGDEFADDIPAVVAARAAISRTEERRQ